jgi:hypothetical protein
MIKSFEQLIHFHKFTYVFIRHGILTVTAITTVNSVKFEIHVTKKKASEL